MTVPVRGGDNCSWSGTRVYDVTATVKRTAYVKSWSGTRVYDVTVTVKRAAYVRSWSGTRGVCVCVCD